MKKAIRLFVMLFVLAASLAAFNSPTPKKATVYAEGSAPRPMCAPGEPCGPDDDLAIK